ncbi:hypothetical protein AAG906_020331 [Vitis piasezkii]
MEESGLCAREMVGSGDAGRHLSERKVAKGGRIRLVRESRIVDSRCRDDGGEYLKMVESGWKARYVRANPKGIRQEERLDLGSLVIVLDIVGVTRRKNVCVQKLVIRAIIRRCRYREGIRSGVRSKIFRRAKAEMGLLCKRRVDGDEVRQSAQRSRDLDQITVSKSGSLWCTVVIRSGRYGKGGIRVQS